MNPRLQVTDHAILRWLERVEGININAIRNRILATARIGVEHGASSVRKDGVTFHLSYDEEQANVVTCYSPKTRNHLAEARVPATQRDGDE